MTWWTDLRYALRSFRKNPRSRRSPCSRSRSGLGANTAVFSFLAAGIAERLPAIKKDWGTTVDRLVDRIVGDQLRLSLFVLTAAVGAVLLIGCARSDGRAPPGVGRRSEVASPRRT